MIRLAVLGLSLEANTFSTAKTTMASMQGRSGIHRGEEIGAQYLGSTATLAGFLDPDLPEGVELVPLVSYRAGAAGSFTAEAFDEATADLVRSLEEAGEIDGVLLSLHGAAVSENAEFADAEIAARVRRAVGPKVPVGIVLDMHANVGPELLRQVDVIRIFQTNPHIDAAEQALECRQEIIDIIKGAPRPVMALERLPLIVNIVKQDTDDEPMAGILRFAHEFECEEGVRDVSVIEGFPYSDVEQMGMAVLVSHRDDAARAQAIALEVAGNMWRAREELQASATTIRKALEHVREHAGEKPIVLLDVGDNVGGGSSGDSTSILNEAVAMGVGNIAMSLWDPQTVEELEEAAIGETVTVEMGGRSAEQDGHPQTLTATLTARADGRFEDHGPTHGGLSRFDVGPSVALRTEDDIAIVVTSYPTGNTSAELLRMVGIEPLEFAAVVAKGVNSPKAGYGSTASDFLMVDTPGVTRLSVEGFTYTRRHRPMYPYEPETQYSPGTFPRSQ